MSYYYGQTTNKGDAFKWQVVFLFYVKLVLGLLGLSNTLFYDKYR